MTAVAFDTLIFTKKMREAGFTEQQAEAQASAIAEIIDDNLATKKDIELVRKDIELVRKDIELIRKELIIKLGAMLVASTSILGFLIRLGH